MAHQSRPRPWFASGLALVVATVSALSAAAVMTVLTAGSAHAATKPRPPRIVFQRENTFGDYRIMLGRPNGKAGNLTGEGASSTIPVWSPHGGQIAFARYFVHPNGFTSAATDLVIMGARGRNKQVVLPSRRQNFIDDIAWAPGGRRLALVMFRDFGTETGETSDIWIFDRATGQVKPLHVDHPGAWIDHVDWSPDGTMLAFSSIDFTDGADEDTDIFTVRPDGTGAKTILGNPKRSEDDPHFSRDGTRLLFAADTNTGRCAFPMISTAGGTNPRRAHSGCLLNSASWSPNGKRILVSQLNGRKLRDEIWAVDPFGTFRRLITTGEYPSWRPTS